MHGLADRREMKAGGSPWLSRKCVRPGAALRLVCLPYAGGNDFIFRGWEGAAPAGVDVCAVRLPGRGARLHEPLLTRMEPLVGGLGQALLPILDGPFALFGHSMGALVAFELARFLRAALGREPAVLFVSASRSPEIPDARKDYVLPEADFIASLRRLNATPAEILDNPEALRLLAPIVRADLEVDQTYEYREGPPLGCRIRAFGGIEDAVVTPDMLRPWSSHTAGSFALSLLPVGHFFIHDSREQLLSILAQELAQVLARLRPAG